MRKTVTLAVCLSLGGPLAVAAAAPARAAEPQIVVQAAEILPGEIAAATHTIASATQDESTRILGYVGEQAQAGRLVDVTDVKIATLPNPLGGWPITSVWDGGAAPRKIWVADQFNGDGQKAQDVSTELNDSQDLGNTGAGQAGGFGSSGATSTSGMYLYSNACVQNYWDPHIYASSEDHHATSCFQKFAKSGSNVWAYNRWATFLMAKPSTGSARIDDFSIRSRPWKGYEQLVTGLNDYEPRAGHASCNTYSFTVSAFNVSFAAPMYDCTQNFLVYPDASKHSMGSNIFKVEGRQTSIDFGMNINASNSSVVPIMADYMYERTYWSCTFCTTGGSWAVSRQDDGW